MGGRRQSFSIGITSIAVIFTVVSLTIFAVLSVSTAVRERDLAEKYAGSVSEYWVADKKCTEIVNRLGGLWEQGAGSAELQAVAEENGAEFYDDGEVIYIYFEEPVNDSNSIAVSLEIGDVFNITGWQELYTGDWDADMGLDLFIQ